MERVERAAVHQLHRQEVLIPGLLDRMDGDDAGMVEGRDGLGLAGEALTAFGVRDFGR
jgi:hypothetical protein